MYEMLAGHVWRCASKVRNLPVDQVTKPHIVVSFAGYFAHSVYEDAITQWGDDRNHMVIKFEFDDQPVVHMKYSVDARPMIIYKAMKQKLGIILNCELAMWSV
ncbi:hypothetical protein ACFXTH_028333 [Malus domestica]